MSEKSQPGTRRALFAIVPVIIVLFPLGYSVVSSLFAQDTLPGGTFLERPAPEHENCVKDTAYMRFHHWELLREVRKEVVRHGRRGDLGLSKCGECHTSRERFCNRCHDAVSLHPDCFGCHYYP